MKITGTTRGGGIYSHNGCGGEKEAEVLSGYIDYLERKDFAQSTIQRRITSLSALARFVLPTHLLDVSLVQVEEWLGTYKSPATRHHYGSDVKMFFRWAHRYDVTDNDPMRYWDDPSVPETPPKPTRDEDLALALSYGDERIRAMLALGALAGLRRSEIANLYREDVRDHARPPVIEVRNSKGGKTRWVPLNPTLIDFLAPLPRRGPLFPKSDGTPVAPVYVGRLLASHFRTLGIKATAHQLRHWFGTTMTIETNGNLVDVGMAMGHTSTQTTKGYVKASGIVGAAAIGRMRLPSEWSEAAPGSPWKVEPVGALPVGSRALPPPPPPPPS